jgi:predicted transcriptional regulator
MTPTPQQTIEDVLCSKTRLKILKALIDYQRGPSEIATIVDANFQKTRKCLQMLESEGILTHVKFGKRIRYYKYDKTPKAIAVQTFMDVFQKSQPE